MSRHTRIKVILSHGGGFLPCAALRLIGASQFNPGTTPEGILAGGAESLLHGGGRYALAVDRGPRSRRALHAALDELGGQYGHAVFVWVMMQVLDDEPIVVLHPGEGKGFRVRISGSADNFQLHTLLADVLIGRFPGPVAPGRALGSGRGHCRP